MKIGLLRETKSPPDRRAPLTPEQCQRLRNDYPELDLVVQPSDIRCFTDNEYRNEGIVLQENLSDCDILMGVKEVDISSLIPGKSYLFFSHTAKEQPYNRGLLRAICDKGITLIDYEYLTGPDNTRVVAFGRWAGIVGAYNGLRALGLREDKYNLQPAWKLTGLADMLEKVCCLPADGTRIVLTGGGRVAQGAMEILNAAGIKELSPAEYLDGNKEYSSFCRLDPWHYTRRIDHQDFDFPHFIEHPEMYENSFLPYARHSDLYIACHYWDPHAPLLLSREDLQIPGFPVRVIADISCDINGPIASTIRASSISEPFYGYDPATGMESADPYREHVITVMAVDNLPGELPRDASEDFGSALTELVISSLLGEDEEGIVRRAMIVERGKLTRLYKYLEQFLANG
ncbi:MAG: NAD(P)-dependent oxidoreductase [Bacteroidales bacterium]